MNVAILEEPYVSDMLVEYLEKENTPVPRNNYAEKRNLNGHHMNLMAEGDIIGQYASSSSSNKVYTVSENALDWVVSQLKDECLNAQIALLKNKTAFREACRNLYPYFLFREVCYADLFALDVAELRFPFVLKPSIGFLSAGVYTILSSDDWHNALEDLRQGFQKQAEKFPDTVIDGTKFLLESYISGKEFAVDVYFRDREPVIVNIFEHPFSSEKDVSDRLYITGKKLFDDYLELFSEYMRKLNSVLHLDNIPIHIELRVDGTNITPIEINPLRFTGMCLNEVNYYITGRHPLDYYFSGTIPDYENMWRGKESDIFSFAILEKPKAASEKSPDIHSILKIFSNILELRIVENPRLDIQAFVFSKTTDQKELQEILSLEI